MDLYILEPVDVNRGKRTLYYDVDNRGTKRFFTHLMLAPMYGPGVNEPTTREGTGDALLLRRLSGSRRGRAAFG